MDKVIGWCNGAPNRPERWARWALIGTLSVVLSAVTASVTLALVSSPFWGGYLLWEHFFH